MPSLLQHVQHNLLTPLALRSQYRTIKSQLLAAPLYKLYSQIWGQYMGKILVPIDKPQHYFTYVVRSVSATNRIPVFYRKCSEQVTHDGCTRVSLHDKTHVVCCRYGMVY